MVRYAKVSLECPAPPACGPSILDDEFRGLDDWPEDERPDGVEEAAGRPSQSPRNLAGVLPEAPVSVKSRRRSRGRTARTGRARMRQVTVSLPFGQWRLLRDEAVRQKIPMSELCRRWFCPHFARMEAQQGENGDNS